MSVHLSVPWASSLCVTERWSIRFIRLFSQSQTITTTDVRRFTAYAPAIRMMHHCSQRCGRRLSHLSRDCHWLHTTSHLTRGALKPSFVCTRWIIPTMSSTTRYALRVASSATCLTTSFTPWLPNAAIAWRTITMHWQMPKHVHG